MTVTLGKKAAPYIKAQAVKVVPDKITKTATEKRADGRSKVDDVIEVAAAGIKGMSNLLFYII